MNLTSKLFKAIKKIARKIEIVMMVETILLPQLIIGEISSRMTNAIVSHVEFRSNGALRGSLRYKISTVKLYIREYNSWYYKLLWENRAKYQ